MIYEFFCGNSLHENMDSCVAIIPDKFYPQERDWTCALACLRTIMQDRYIFKTEVEMVERFELQPGPLYSRDIKEKGLLDNSVVNNTEVRYGCDQGTALDASDLWRLLKDGWSVMIEWCMSDDHWTVLLGFVQAPHGWDILYFDPWWGDVRKISAAEFGVMWHSGVCDVCRDFVAVREQQHN